MIFHLLNQPVGNSNKNQLLIVDNGWICQQQSRSYNNYLRQGIYLEKDRQNQLPTVYCQLNVLLRESE